MAWKNLEYTTQQQASQQPQHYYGTTSSSNRQPGFRGGTIFHHRLHPIQIVNADSFNVLRLKMTRIVVSGLDFVPTEVDGNLGLRFVRKQWYRDIRSRDLHLHQARSSFASPLPSLVGSIVATLPERFKNHRYRQHGSKPSWVDTNPAPLSDSNKNNNSSD